MSFHSISYLCIWGSVESFENAGLIKLGWVENIQLISYNRSTAADKNSQVAPAIKMELHVKCCLAIRVIHTAFQRAFLKPNTQTKSPAANPDKAQCHNGPGLEICSSFPVVEYNET